MQQFEIALQTRGRGTHDLTDQVQQLVIDSGLRIGLCQVFCQHTSASLMLCENADPDVRVDLESFMQRLVPDGDPMFRHIAEGPDDMPAHVRTLVTQSGLTLPIRDGRCALGTWQGIYLWEHRHNAHTRRLLVSLLGEA